MELNTALQKLKEYERRGFACTMPPGSCTTTATSRRISSFAARRTASDTTPRPPNEIPHLFFSRRWFISVDIIPSVDKSTAY